MTRRSVFGVAIRGTRAGRMAPMGFAAALAVILALATWTAIGHRWLAPGGVAPIRIGAVFPLEGNGASLAGEQLRGLRIAADLVNADGGVGGHPLVLDVRDLERRADAPAVMASLKAAGVPVVVGAYSSDLSIAASAAADAAGMVYWEGGAVADQVTGRSLPLVFRVGASGANLGATSATFAAHELAPRLGTSVSALRVAVVNADDAYARSVSDAVVATAGAAGMPIVLRATYNLSVPDWPSVMRALAASRPDVVMLASHIPDGIDFRRAMVAAGLHVGAFIGTTMAQCDPDFAGDLGPDAVGVFAADRPTGGFQPSVLAPEARALYERLAAAWGTGANAPEGSSEYGPGVQDAAGSAVPTAAAEEYPIQGPIESGSAAAGPTEEGLSGFTAGWVLFARVLPDALVGGSLDPLGIAGAARDLDLPLGALPNGAGLRFSADPATLGQNERAAAVIWQWQAVRSYTFVWPPTYATGSIEFVPLNP
jgi:ABC-type branched-subunit amino acid transport system substrate-binding protein